MSIAPPFRNQSRISENPPETRVDTVVAQYLDDLGDDDAPSTRLMDNDELHAAFGAAEPSSRTVEIMLHVDDVEEEFHLPTIPARGVRCDEPEELDEFALLDRKTLPSAPYPTAMAEDPVVGLSWDMPPTPNPPRSEPLPSTNIVFDAGLDTEEVRSPLPSSLWGKLQRFVTAIGKPRSQSSPASSTPASSTSSRKITQRALFDLVWTLDNATLEALAKHLERVTALRRLGPDAYAETRIVDMLDTLAHDERPAGEGVSLALLRMRMPEVARTTFDQAMIRLEQREVVMLVPAQGEVGHEAIFHPSRGPLSHCSLRQTGS